MSVCTTSMPKQHMRSVLLGTLSMNLADKRISGSSQTTATESMVEAVAAGSPMSVR